MKLIFALCFFVASTLATPINNTLISNNGEETVTLHFTNELSSQPDPMSMDFPLDYISRDVGDSESEKRISAIEVTDQSRATATFRCDVYVLGRYFGRFTQKMTYKSIGQSVLLNDVSVQCRP